MECNDNSFSIRMFDKSGKGLKYTDEFSAARYLSTLVRAKLGLKEDPILKGFRETNRSYIFRFRMYHKSADLPADIAVKVFKTKCKKNVGIPDVSFTNLKKVITQFSDLCADIPQLVVPKPLVDMPEVNGIVREWVDGTSLVELMRYGSRFSTQKEREILENHFEQVGKTIGLIQNKSCSYSILSEAEQYAILKSKINSVQFLGYNPCLKKLRIVKSAFAYLRNGLATAAKKNMFITWTHGDFIHSNIVFTPNDKISLIDLADSKCDSPYIDLGSFTIRTLIDYGYNPIRFNNGYLHKLNGKFLKGYFDSSEHNFSLKIFQYYQIFNLYNYILDSRKPFSPRTCVSLILLKTLLESCYNDY